MNEMMKEQRLREQKEAQESQEDKHARVQRKREVCAIMADLQDPSRQVVNQAMEDDDD